jgi:hypothetical protein
MSGIIDLGKYGYATRDCPNVIIPTLALPLILSPTASWAWPAAYSQIIDPTTYPFLLTQLFQQTNMYGSTAVDGSFHCEELFQTDIGTGVATAETSIGTVIHAASSFIVVSGIVDDEASATGGSTCARDVSFGPVVIPSGSRIAARISKSGVTDGTHVSNVGFYLSGYNLTTLDFASAHFLDDLYVRGMRPNYPKPQVSLGSTPVTAGAAWVLGAYAVVTASLDEDYLIRSVAIQPKITTATKSAQFDISLGAAGSEVVQARASRVGFSSFSYRGISHIEFKYPFIAYKGERLTIRAASALASAIYNVMIFGERMT